MNCNLCGTHSTQQGDNDGWLCEECCEELYMQTDEFKELRITHNANTAKLKKIIKAMAAQYVGKYPTYQYADALAKALAGINWEEEFHPGDKSEARSSFNTLLGDIEIDL